MSNSAGHYYSSFSGIEFLNPINADMWWDCSPLKISVSDHIRMRENVQGYFFRNQVKQYKDFLHEKSNSFDAFPQ